MEKGFNLKSKELKEQIIETINSSNLPPVLIKYTLIDLLNIVHQLEIEAIQKETENFEKEEKDVQD